MANIEQVQEAVVICGLREAKCECVLPQGHDGPHECDPGCNGSWDFDERGNFVTVRLPDIFGPGGRRV